MSAMKMKKALRSLRKATGGRRPRGFTLLELLVGMVVLVIGILASMAMQSTALAGFAAARDATAAAEVGRVIEHLMRVESQQWRAGGLTTFQPALDDTGPLEGDSLIVQVEGSNWAWQTLTGEPVDPRLATSGPRRFCAYARGGRKVGQMGNLEDVLLVQVAVVYPAARGSFPNLSTVTPHGTCELGANLDAMLTPNSNETIEMAGLRVTYFGFQIFPRS